MIELSQKCWPSLFVLFSWQKFLVNILKSLSKKYSIVSNYEQWSDIELEERYVIIEKLRAMCLLAGPLIGMQLAAQDKFVEMVGATTAHLGLTNVLVIKGFGLRPVQTISSAIPLDASLQASPMLIRKYISQISPCAVQPQRRLRLHRLVTIIVEKRQIRVITFTLPLLCNLVPHPSPEFQEQKLDT